MLTKQQVSLYGIKASWCIGICYYKSMGACRIYLKSIVFAWAENPGQGAAFVTSGSVARTPLHNSWLYMGTVLRSR